jgi:hypothetical protein
MKQDKSSERIDLQLTVMNGRLCCTPQLARFCKPCPNRFRHDLTNNFDSIPEYCCAANVVYVNCTDTD